MITITPDKTLPDEMPIVLDLKLDDVSIKAGTKVTALKVNDKWYKVYHHTGWWKVPAEYFEIPKLTP